MTRVTRDHIGTVRLIDRKTRVVEVLGPEPLGSRYPTDRKLLLEPPGQAAYLWGGQVAHCFQADGRQARFLVNEGQWATHCSTLGLAASDPSASR